VVLQSCVPAQVGALIVSSDRVIDIFVGLCNEGTSSVLTSRCYEIQVGRLKIVCESLFKLKNICQRLYFRDLVTFLIYFLVKLCSEKCFSRSFILCTDLGSLWQMNAIGFKISSLKRVNEGNVKISVVSCSNWELASGTGVTFAYIIG